MSKPNEDQFESWKLARSVVEHENDLVNHRITWLLATHAALLAALFVLLVKYFEINSQEDPKKNQCCCGREPISTVAIPLPTVDFIGPQNAQQVTAADPTKPRVPGKLVESKESDAKKEKSRQEVLNLIILLCTVGSLTSSTIFYAVRRANVALSEITEWFQSQKAASGPKLHLWNEDNKWLRNFFGTDSLPAVFQCLWIILIIWTLVRKARNPGETADGEDHVAKITVWFLSAISLATLAAIIWRPKYRPSNITRSYQRRRWKPKW